MPIEELPIRLDHSLDRWGCRKQIVTLQEFNWSHLRARVEQIKEQFGLATAPPIPLRQLRINALHKLSTQPGTVTARDWRLISWGLVDECGNAGRALADSSLYPRIAKHFEQEINGGSLSRKTWLGLVYSYLAHKPEPEGGVEYKHWLQLRKLVLDGFHKIRQGKQRECTWVELVGLHLDLFTDNAGVTLGEAIFEGRQQMIDELRSFLQIPAESWLWTDILAAQLKRVIVLDDDGFASRIDGMLDWAGYHPQSTDQILAGLLTRYEQSERLSAKPYPRLKSVSLEAWGSPQIGRNKGRWSVCVEDRVSKMVMRWFAKEDLETFFSLLRDEEEADERRLNYWLRYVDQMTYTRIVMGRNALNSRSSDFCEFRAHNKGRFSELAGGVAADNAFIMQIGDFVFVEFSKVGNACYFYKNTQLPFDDSAARLHLNSDLKVKRHININDIKINKFSHSEYWESRADSIMSGLGVLENHFAVKVANKSDGVNYFSGAFSPPDQGEHPKIKFDSLNELVALVRKRAEMAGYSDLEIEDRRTVGGALWIKTTELRKIDSCLKSMGFKYKNGSGYWIK